MTKMGKKQTPPVKAEEKKDDKGKKNDNKGKEKKGSSESLSSAPVPSPNESSPPQPPSLFGNWTGKTPLSLLYEHNQRQDWVKPIIHVVQYPYISVYAQSLKPK